MDSATRLPLGMQVAGGNSEMEEQAILQEAEQQAEAERQAATQAEQQSVTEQSAAGVASQSAAPQEGTVSGLIESIANANAAAPYLNPDGTLLNAQNAVIDPAKLYSYSLDPDHPKGGDKAVVFQSALGYNQSNADSLIQQVQQGIQQNSASVYPSGNFGPQFTVDIPVTGPNGNTTAVRTGWIYDPGSDKPRLTTAYVK